MSMVMQIRKWEYSGQLLGGIKVENGVENGRRGRIHTLLIGDPGTTKTLLQYESTKLDSNSRMVDATGASGKSLVGIVDKENDSLMVKYGVVVAAEKFSCCYK